MKRKLKGAGYNHMGNQLKTGGSGKMKTADVAPWIPILKGSLVVWFLTCNRQFSELIRTHKNNIAVAGITVYLMILAYALYQKKDTKIIIRLILSGGFLIRAYYTFAAPYGITRHDLGYFTGFGISEVSAGHAGYIDYLVKNGHLFDSDPRTMWGFYQPPFFYIIAAVVLKVTVLSEVPEPLCYESVQIVTLFFSSLTVWTLYRIIKEFEISEKLTVILVAFLSFHPFFLIMSVTVTNDCVAMYFMALAVWHTIRWQKEHEMKNIIAIAFAVGLAMASKINAALISFGIAAVFLSVFWKNRREYKKYILQFVVFLLICAPIGLFNPVRNYVKHNVPFTYIQGLTAEEPQFIQNSTALSRLGIPSIRQMSYAFPTFDPVIERNVWVQALRTSLFDEMMPDVGSSLFGAEALVLLWAAIALAVFMNIAFVWHICRNLAAKSELQVFFVIEYATMLIGYAKFCMDEPFICTMNYRYIPITLLFPLLGTAMWIQERQGKKSGISAMAMKNILIGGMLCFAALALVVDMNLISWSGTLL